ncbi:unnamed protein product, partial [Symbiodinium natans]
DCLRIGRDPASEVPVNLPGVSWAHAELRLGANGALCLRDLSSNGTGFKDASGGIARVKRGLDVEVPEKSLVVLPLKVKAATNAIESRMCFAVELNSEEPPPDPLEEARKLQPQLVREVQAALQEQLAQAPAPAPGQPEPSAEPPAEPPAEPQLERAAPEETPEAPEPKPAKEAEDATWQPKVEPFLPFCPLPLLLGSGFPYTVTKRLTTLILILILVPGQTKEREEKDEKEKKERREKASKEAKVKESKETGRSGRSRQGRRS